MINLLDNVDDNSHLDDVRYHKMRRLVIIREGHA